MKLLFALSVLMMSTFASAQTPSPSPTATPVDTSQFQTLSFFRLQNGDFETIPAQTFSYSVLDPVTGKPILDPMTGKKQVQESQSYLYDARNPLPKIAVAAGNYAVLSDKSLVTFGWDRPLAKGKLHFDVDTYGGNFMIKKGTREIVTISSTGYVNFSTTVTAPAIRLVGGNYFIDQSNDLWTIDSKGYVYHLTATKYPLAQLPGGNYFYQQDGTIVTIGADGIAQPAFQSTSKPLSLGGNYYIAEDGFIYSVRYDGISYQNGKTLGKVKHLGYSYVVYDNGAFVAIDGMGVVHTDAVRVTSTKSKFTKVTSIKDAIDPASVWTPNARRN